MYFKAVRNFHFWQMSGKALLAQLVVFSNVIEVKSSKKFAANYFVQTNNSIIRLNPFIIKFPYC